MKYALGNMLNGAGGLNADGLSLDLQFAADKTLTARKGPTPVFTRGSSATQVGASGLIEYAPENLILNSQNTTPWQITGLVSKVSQDSVVAPDGTTTADTIQFTGANGYLTSTTVFTGGFPTVISAWVKTSSGTADFRLQLSDNASSNFTATTTWQRFSFFSAAGNLSSYSGIRAASDGSTSTLDVWGFQVERFSSARAYIPTTTAAIYGARFDHDPVTLACKGLLIEESRTNLYPRSEEFNDANWTKTRASITANTTTAPNGTLTADKLVEDTSILNTHTLGSPVTPPATSHTLSVFAKKGERNFIVLRLGGANDFFNLNTGVALTNVNSPTITNFGNGWYRCTVTSSAGTQGSFQMSADGITTLYTGDGTSGIFLWGAQLEAGSFPTSYIPTTTASLARSADVCSITGSAFTGFWNNNEGTVLASGDPRGSAAAAILLMANSGSNANQIAVDRATTTIKFGIANSSSYTASIQQNSTNASFVKMSGSYATNDARSALNGVLGTPDTSVIVPTNLIRLNIGSAGLASQEFANGCIFAIRYFRKPLSNAKLQSLTA